MVDNSIAEAVSNSTLETVFLKLFKPDADTNKVFNNTPILVYIKLSAIHYVNFSFLSIKANLMALKYE
jgi:hypothetical protein